MNEYHAIKLADGLSPLDKLRYYMEYFINCLPDKASISFEKFCSPKNVIRHDVGEGWKERGFASQSWVNLSGGSIYHSVYHSLISKSLQPKPEFKYSSLLTLTDEEIKQGIQFSKDYMNTFWGTPIKQVTND